MDGEHDPRDETNGENDSRDGTDGGRDPTGGIDRRTVLKGTAAAGIAGAGVAGTASAGGWHELDLCAAGDDLFYFRVEVTGKLERGGKYATDKQDEVGSNYVDGQVWKGKCDSYRFTGEIETLELSGPGKVFVDGKLVRNTTEPPHKVTIEAKGHPVSYRFKASGHVKGGKWADGDDAVIDSSVVRGQVEGEDVDTYWFGGTLAFEEPDGPLDVTVEYHEA